MSCGCINLWTRLLFLWVFAIVWQCCHTWFRAMLPGHWTNYPDTMWNYGWSAPGFPSPQSGLPYGQFCGGDMMRQQSQAQSQAQTQVQLAQLREQNSILNQQLASQAQTHIQHLQQLLPFHQSNTPVMQPQPNPPAPDPPNSNTSDTNSNTSGIFVHPTGVQRRFQSRGDDATDATYCRIRYTGLHGEEQRVTKSPLPQGDQPPLPVTTPIPSQHPPPVSTLPPLPRLHRRSRSRSQRHYSGLDKRPVSIPRSPRRERLLSRPHHRSRHSKSRDRSRLPSRAPSVTLRSASPRRREVLHGRDDDYARDDLRYQPASLQPASWDYQHYDPPTTSYQDDHHSNYRSYDLSSTNKWKSSGQWKHHSKTSYYTHPSGWIDYSKPQYKHPSYNDPSSKPSSKPLTAFSSDHPSQGYSQYPRRSGSVQSRTSTVPPGHVPINLQDGSKDEWARHVSHALRHPDRMRAANELTSDERPQPSSSIVHAEYDEAMEKLHKVDPRIPGDIARKAVQLLFSTGLLPAYDLSSCHVRELPQTSMLALVMPLPDVSRFQMPPPFGGQQNITWALCHGTTIRTSQLILLEGKIRPANWSYHRNPQRCHLPTFGAFYIGRQVSNADQDFPSWAEKELTPWLHGEEGKRPTRNHCRCDVSRSTGTSSTESWRQWKRPTQRGWVTTPEKYTIAHSNHVGLKFIALKWADLKSIDLRDTDSEDNVNYRPNEERHSDRKRGWALNTALSARVLLAYVVLNRIFQFFLGNTWTNAMAKSALLTLLFCLISDFLSFVSSCCMVSSFVPLFCISRVTESDRLLITRCTFSILFEFHWH